MKKTKPATNLALALPTALTSGRRGEPRYLGQCIHAWHGGGGPPVYGVTRQVCEICNAVCERDVLGKIEYYSAPSDTERLERLYKPRRR